MGHWGTSWIDNPHVDTLTVLISNDIRCLGTETIEKPFAFIYWGNGRTWDPFAPRLRTQDGEHPEPPDLERPRHPSTNPAMSRIYSEINDDDDDDDDDGDDDGDCNCSSQFAPPACLGKHPLMSASRDNKSSTA